jgi:hypothetical protein
MKWITRVGKPKTIVVIHEKAIQAFLEPEQDSGHDVNCCISTYLYL